MISFDPTITSYLELLEKLRQSVIATDSNGTIVHWNAAAERLYGWPAGAVVGRNVLDVTPADLSRSEAEEIMKFIARGEVWSGQFPVHDRHGKAFLASVTDVPLLNDARDVEGVIGVSAPSRKTTAVAELLQAFGAACDAVWPGQVQYRVNLPKRANVAASEPHLIQLLALLLLRYAAVLDRKGAVDVLVSTTANSPFSEFGLISTGGADALYIRIDSRETKARASVLRTVSRLSEPTKNVSALVRMVGGMLVTDADADETGALHLFLPFAA